VTDNLAVVPDTPTVGLPAEHSAEPAPAEREERELPAPAEPERRDAKRPIDLDAGSTENYHAAADEDRRRDEDELDRERERPDEDDAAPQQQQRARPPDMPPGWSDDDAETWERLTPRAKERERQRDLHIRQKLNEVATQRQQIEAVTQQVRARAAAYDRALIASVVDVEAEAPKYAEIALDRA
jgi:hypothetical protein